MKNSDFSSYTLSRYKFGKTVTEIHQNLITTFPESCPTLKTILRWGCEWHFHPGEGSQPLETRTPENIARVKELIEQNPRISTRKLLQTFLYEM